ncbi:hypothetical protein Egran_01910 [Elaphomyces granulatus]|uniref:DNA-directed RNA polymerase III subunit RPC3 n=1 Tax=Elaphomyces granulatus TaxID=519963 RepID=A0A232M2L5_9EURO|nr:hypothetical protein Egran_01910 [Elaphomyces granulatus]
MSQYATELCTLLVEDNFGELFARIFSTLQRYDRLALPRLKFYSRLSDKKLHHGLAAMIQMHLVFHHTSFDDGVTYYEANMQAAYYLVRSGKILEIIEDNLGVYASRVMSTIMYLGHAQVSYLETLPELVSEQVSTDGINGTLGSHNVNGQSQSMILNGSHAASGSHAKLHQTLTSLAAHGYIVRVREAHFQSSVDTMMSAERIVKAKQDAKQLKGKNLERFLQDGITDLIQERTEGDLSHGLIRNGVPRGIKRRRVNRLGEESNKRPRLDSSVRLPFEKLDSDEDELTDNELVDEDPPMESDLVVRINHEKLDVVLRNRRLAELSEHSTSSITAQVYECLLRRIEYQTQRCREEPEIPREGEEGEIYSTPISLHTLVEDIDPGLDLAGSIGPMLPPEIPGRGGKRPPDNGVNGSGPQSRASEVDQHLVLLAQPPYAFSYRQINSGMITWTVEYRHLARKLRHLELERIIQSRYGNVALRIVRVLLAKGKLDEKRLQEITLLPPKDLRQVLAKMQGGGFVDLQELPREAQRLPSRTIYLWFYDPDRVRRNVLQDTYKTMSRCVQRIKFERSRLKDFLDKTERSDIKGNEERCLSEAELVLLRQWRDKEALLLGEVARLDDLVAVLRDF